MRLSGQWMLVVVAGTPFNAVTKMNLVAIVLLSFSTLSSAATFGCTTIGITDQARNLFLNEHNNLRRSIATGVEPNACGNLTTAKNMYELAWDCALEKNAQDHIASCPSSAAIIPLGSGHTLQTITTTNANVLEVVANVLRDWQAKMRNTGLTDPDNKLTNTNFPEFAQMAKGSTRRVGCSYKQCAGDKLTVYCIYNQNGAAIFSTLFEKGPACAADADCTTVANSICKAGLCAAPGTLPPTGMCSFEGIGDETRTVFLKEHNDRRSRAVRGGLEADFYGDFTPQGSQMNKLEWDCEIEKFAQEWTEGCVMSHSTTDERKHGTEQWGENLYMTSANNQLFKDASFTASDLWWGELAEYGVGQANNLTAAVWTTTKPNGQIGHYTQMAWGTTSRLGCGIKNCPSSTLVTCQYATGGNYMNSLIYKLGPVCSQCGAGFTCDPAVGLCVKV